MRIFAFHLLNDYSGSPKVLMQLAKGWVKNGVDVTIVTSSGREGFLSDINHSTTVNFWYRLSPNPIIRLLFLVISQIIVIGKLWFRVKRSDIIYVNTVLPFGAAILGKLKGCRVIYHIHETSMKPKMFKNFLFGVVKHCAHDVIYVSEYLAKQEPISNVRTHIMYNAIENDFLANAIRYRKMKKVKNNVLMVCSLKKYKGIFEFVDLAVRNQNYMFRLVLNAQLTDIEHFFKGINLPANLEIFPTQTNLHPFYRWADVVLNLSITDEWIETFGLTIIEGMSYGLPAIVPPVGGIAELIEDDKNGFIVNSKDSELLSYRLHNILDNADVYTKMSKVTKTKIDAFSEHNFINHSLTILYR